MNRDIMIAAGMKQAVERFEDGLCATCGNEPGVFKDALSRREYGISGMCQPCQDMLFDFELFGFEGEEDNETI
jgi:hypothetical protein|tara:strand:+ start:1914 stop:2132 length:219 start_codon:yes stop_codon:yes gene_type:complete